MRRIFGACSATLDDDTTLGSPHFAAKGQLFPLIIFISSSESSDEW